MSTDRELMQEAWETLNLVLAPFPVDDQRCLRVAGMLEKRLKQPAPPTECNTEQEKAAFAFGWWKALEAQRLGQTDPMPLTDNELADLWYKQSTDWMEFARAVEAAHGIKGS